MAMMGSLAFTVASASHLHTSDVRISIISWFADTDGSVIWNNAARVESARAWVSADSIDAGSRSVTLVVSFASGHQRGQSDAFIVVVGDVSFGAFANHQANRLGVDHAAAGARVARLKLFARVQALLFQADLRHGTILVLHAFWRSQRNTPEEWVSGEAGSAPALGNVVHGLTVGVISTRVASETGVNAGSVLAGSVGRAL